MKPCRSATSSVDPDLPPSGTDISLLCCIWGGSSTPLPLFQVPHLPWGVRCTFRAGYPPPLTVGGPMDCLMQLPRQKGAVEYVRQTILLLFFESLNTVFPGPALC